MGSQSWKNAERAIATTLTKAGIESKRISRAGNFSVSDVDIEVPEHLSFLRIDAKFSKARPFRHHGLMKTIAAKYCKDKYDEPILYSKNYREHSGYITIRAEFFAELIKYHPGRTKQL